MFHQIYRPIQNCCVVELSQGATIGHAAVFHSVKTNSENDGNYYFKNSHGANEPWIIIPKNRATTEQARTYTECADKGTDGAKFKELMNDQNKNITPSQVIQIFKDTLAPLAVHLDLLNLSENEPQWRIGDTAYALIIEKI